MNEDQKVSVEHREKMLAHLTAYELKKELDRKRILNVDRRTTAVELDLARVREDLIEKELVIKMLSFLVVSVRQKFLAFPTTYARRLLRKDDIKEIHAILQKGVFEVLDELKDLPYKVTDPAWMEKIAEEEE